MASTDDHGHAQAGDNEDELIDIMNDDDAGRAAESLAELRAENQRMRLELDEVRAACQPLQAELDELRAASETRKKELDQRCLFVEHEHWKMMQKAIEQNRTDRRQAEREEQLRGREASCKQANVAQGPLDSGGGGGGRRRRRRGGVK